MTSAPTTRPPATTTPTKRRTPSRATGKDRPRHPGRARRTALPYLLLLPALLLELLIHLVPMVMGIVASFRELTQFHIRDWTGAPWAGLDNYDLVIDVNRPVGEALLRSFLTTCLFTLLSVALCWLIGTAAAVFTQESFRGRGVLRALFLVRTRCPSTRPSSPGRSCSSATTAW